MEDLMIKKIYAECKEIKVPSDDCMERMKEQAQYLRVYKNSPDTFMFQIRTFKPITDSKTGKFRFMMANVSLTLAELKKIIKYAERRCR